MIVHQANPRRLRLLRDARGWTQEQLANSAGYSVKTIWKAEAGRPLKRQTLTDIARALGVEFEHIVNATSRQTRRSQTQLLTLSE